MKSVVWKWIKPAAPGQPSPGMDIEFMGRKFSIGRDIGPGLGRVYVMLSKHLDLGEDHEVPMFCGHYGDLGKLFGTIRLRVSEVLLERLADVT